MPRKFVFSPGAPEADEYRRTIARQMRGLAHTLDIVGRKLEVLRKRAARVELAERVAKDGSSNGAWHWLTGENAARAVSEAAYRLREAAKQNGV